MNLARLAETLEAINQYGYSDNGITRLAYSNIERESVHYFARLCEQEGMKVRIDGFGNMIARREGENPNLPVVACGSHFDTVFQAGKYDGTIGVVGALEVVRRLNEKGIETEHPIEIICFACEESARFGVATIGSKAMTGNFRKEKLTKLVDKEGISLAEALLNCNLNPDELEQSVRPKEEFKVFFELHVEQGPLLENNETQIGIAVGIAAPTRFKLQISGRASHSGTTPMNARQDAFLGAAEIALSVEEAANREQKYGTVGTVGVCELKNGAMNVVPGYVEIKIDIRGVSIESRGRVIEDLYRAIERQRQKRGLHIDVKELSNELPIQLNGEVIDSLVELCERSQFSYLLMPSGAGHDAMAMAKHCPTGLILIPSKDGLSHHPNEFTSIEQIGVGVALLEMELMKWARCIER